MCMVFRPNEASGEGKFIAELASKFRQSFKFNPKPVILVCGNGGSASQAEHLVGELIGRYNGNSEPIASICLSSSSSVVTALANDCGYENVFSNQVRAFGCVNSILICLSTSGTSPNVMNAALEAHEMGMQIFSIIGDNYHTVDLATLSDYTLRLPGNTQEIQEHTLKVIHRIAGTLKEIYVQ